MHWKQDQLYSVTGCEKALDAFAGGLHQAATVRGDRVWVWHVCYQMIWFIYPSFLTLMLQALTIKGNVCAVWMRLGERRFPPKLNFSIRVSNYTNWGSNQHVFHRQHSRSFTNMHAPLLLCAGSTDARGDIVTSIRKNVGPTSEMRLRPELRGGLALLIYANDSTQSNKSCVLLCDWCLSHRHTKTPESISPQPTTAKTLYHHPVSSVGLRWLGCFHILVFVICFCFSSADCRHFSA